MTVHATPTQCADCRWYTGRLGVYSLANRCGHPAVQAWTGRSSVPPLASIAREARPNPSPCGPAALLYQPRSTP